MAPELERAQAAWREKKRLEQAESPAQKAARRRECWSYGLQSGAPGDGKQDTSGLDRAKAEWLEKKRLELAERARSRPVTRRTSARQAAAPSKRRAEEAPEVARGEGRDGGAKRARVRRGGKKVKDVGAAGAGSEASGGADEADLQAAMAECVQAAVVAGSAAVSDGVEAGDVVGFNSTMEGSAQSSEAAEEPFPSSSYVEPAEEPLASPSNGVAGPRQGGSGTALPGVCGSAPGVAADIGAPHQGDRFGLTALAPSPPAAAAAVAAASDLERAQAAWREQKLLEQAESPAQKAARRAIAGAARREAMSAALYARAPGAVITDANELDRAKAEWQRKKWLERAAKMTKKK